MPWLTRIGAEKGNCLSANDLYLEMMLDDEVVVDANTLLLCFRYCGSYQ